MQHKKIFCGPKNLKRKCSKIKLHSSELHKNKKVGKLSKYNQTMRYLITGELYSVTIYMNYLNRFLCETNLAKITIFYL